MSDKNQIQLFDDKPYFEYPHPRETYVRPFPLVPKDTGQYADMTAELRNANAQIGRGNG